MMDMSDYEKLQRLELILKGLICVYYFDVLIAIVDHQGLIKWRDVHYPIALINHLLTIPTVEEARRN